MCSLETRTCIYTRLYILVEWKCIQSFLNRGKGRHYLASGYKSICFQTNNNTKLQMRSFTGFLYFIKKSILYVCIFSMHANHFALNRMFQNVSRHFSSKINSQLMHSFDWCDELKCWRLSPFMGDFRVLYIVIRKLIRLQVTYFSNRRLFSTVV